MDSENQDLLEYAKEDFRMTEIINAWALQCLKDDSFLESGNTFSSEKMKEYLDKSDIFIFDGTNIFLEMYEKNFGKEFYAGWRYTIDLLVRQLCLCFPGKFGRYNGEHILSVFCSITWYGEKKEELTIFDKEYFNEEFPS